MPLPLSAYHAGRSTQEEKKERAQKKEQTLTLRKRKMDKLMKYVRGLRSTEQVPISYVVERFQSDIRSAKFFAIHVGGTASIL